MSFTVTIHPISFLFGIIVGLVLSSFVMFKMMYDDKYYTAWGVGWHAGFKNAKNELENETH